MTQTSTPPVPAISASQARQEATRVTVIGMILDLVLAAAKVIGGVVGQSFALVVDGIHSLSDAVTDIFVITVARVSHADPDHEHPYGHGRFETLGTIALGIALFVTAGILLWDSYGRLQSAPATTLPAVGTLVIAVISIAGKEWIFQYTMRVARRLNSNLLRANAWHSRSDAISSIAVLIGLVGARQGYAWMDTVAAIFVALLIARVAWHLCADSLRELVDTAMPDARQQQVRSCIEEVEGIEGITSLRSRLSGGNILLEAHLLVNPRITVSEGHQLGERVRRSLLARFSDINDVLVHIDSESHDQQAEYEDARQQLPERPEILASIREQWQGLLDETHIDRVNLHYLEEGIEVELVLNLEDVTPVLAEQLESALGDLAFLKRLRIYRKLYDTHEPVGPTS